MSGGNFPGYTVYTSEPTKPGDYSTVRVTRVIVNCPRCDWQADISGAGDLPARAFALLAEHRTTVAHR